LLTEIVFVVPIGIVRGYLIALKSFLEGNELSFYPELSLII